MQLLILILHNSRHMDKVLAAFMAEGIGGGSLVDCEGVLQARWLWDLQSALCNTCI